MKLYTDKNTLHLNLHKKWFDMTYTRIKKEEYREITPYWVRRLVDTSDYPEEQKRDRTLIPPCVVFDLVECKYSLEDVLRGYYSKLKKFDSIIFSNGYKKDRCQFEIEFKGIRVGKGRKEWGGDPDKQYFIIEHGEILQANFLKLTNGVL